MKKKLFMVLLSAMTLLMLAQICLANDKADGRIPSTTGMMTFFYYDNHAEAVDFYTKLNVYS